jgi:rubrerythrin
MVRLWRKTAREEMNHAAQFTLALEAMSEVIATTVGNPSALDHLRRAIENLIEEFRLHRPTLREALEAAIALETSMSRLHTDQIVVFMDPRCRRLFEAMMAADAGHIACLRVALHQLGSADV